MHSPEKPGVFVNASALIFGGANIDIKCHIEGQTVSGTSNPGHMEVNSGGVGRNIAHNLVLLGCKTQLFTALGADSHGDMLRGGCARAGIMLHAHVTDQPTGTYTAVLGRDGDLVIAVAAMAVMDCMTPAALRPFLPQFNPADLVVADANLPEQTLLFLAQAAQAAGARFIFEPVSVPKCGKIRAAFGRHLIFLMSPNRAQITELTGVAADDAQGLAAACAILHEFGVQNLIVGLGAAGAYWSDGSAHGSVPALQNQIVDATGGGDAALAAAVWALAQGWPLHRAALIGQRAAGLAVTCAASVNAQMSPALLVRDES